jgi:uncharacterized protein involved in type VI secretion and phage assembly
MTLLSEALVDGGDGEGRGLITGVTVGVVTDNRDPDALARVRVRLPWHDEGNVSDWSRIAVPMAGKDQGTFFLPEIGDEVLVAAEQGDPSHLYVVGMLWNGQLKPPETNADGKNDKRFIKTRAGHQLMFNDGEGTPLASLSLADGKTLTLDRDGIRIDDGKGSTIEIDSNSGAITIQAAATLTLKSKAVKIVADASLELKSSGTLTVKGTLVQIN